MTPDAIACDVLMHAIRTAEAYSDQQRRAGRNVEWLGALGVCFALIDQLEAVEARLNDTLKEAA